ncbi:MAG: saccharopine dehydrogenase NADP-binding domain-containing protein [Theionarchaea archaeon]|nr:saccharopine dehydrogenase NADP-binding domain-containing protein [Theionarchaea archaeon]
MQVAVLGCGTVGTTAIKTLDALGVFDTITVGDINIHYAENVADTCSCETLCVKCNAEDPEQLRDVMKGSDVVLNCVGPFYKYGPPILTAAIEEGVNYVDVCDDLDATIEQLELHQKAIQNDVSALIGMGSSPGLANVLVKFCENFFDIKSVDIYHAHGGEETEGAAVVKHRIHSMKMEIPVFLNGALQYVRLFEESGQALEEECEFPGVGTYRVYAYPHPETITLPQHITGVQRVTNLGLVLPPGYAELIKGVVRLGITGEEPITVNGGRVVPLDFAVAFILSQREQLLKNAGFTEPMGSLKIVVGGEREGKKEKYIFALGSRGQGMGEGTGIPAAIGATLMAQGKIPKKGVSPPEACVNPLEVLSLAAKALQSTGKGELPFVIERIDEQGKKTEIDYKKIFPL